MKNETLRTLEYEKILALLAAEAGSFLGKEAAAALLPSSDFDEVEERLNETAEARDVLTVSSPPLGAIRDIRAALKKAAMDAMLEIEEMADVVSVLYATREAKRFFKELSPELAPTLKERARGLEILGQLENRLDNA
ncbi:MAG: endonuclease MutS2, partial [Schwartzia sp.]|nr:endonuclease MutS2 [Schwartzia sp. (in: firmicutes)]